MTSWPDLPKASATRPEVEIRWSASTSGRSLTAPGRMSTTSGVATMRASSGMR